MDTPEVAAQKQCTALIAFAKSIGHDIAALRWPYRKHMAEPAEYRLWRICRAHVERLELFFDAGLADEPTFSGRAMFEKMLYEAEIAERSAWSAWCRKKESLEMDLLCGRRKTLPWSC